MPNSFVRTEFTGPKSTSNIKRKDIASTTTDKIDGRKKITRYTLVPASCFESKKAIRNERGKMMKFCTGKHSNELRRLFWIAMSSPMNISRNSMTNRSMPNHSYCAVCELK